MASPQFVELLCNHVDNLHDYKSFTPIMKAMAFDIQELQNLIKSKIRKLNATVAREVTYNAMPMDSLLPMDTIQHIVSFNDCKNVKFVCGSFKKSFERNQEIIHRSRKRIVAENTHRFSPDIPFDESIGKTYVLRPAGEPLVERIKELGDKVVVHDDFMRCLRDLAGSSGARIFVQSGRYEIECKDGLDIENQDVEIIGIGEKVEIHFDNNIAEEYDCAFNIGGNSKVLFENITFTFTGTLIHDATTIGVWDDSIIWMNRCNLGCRSSNVNLSENARGHFQSCQFASSHCAIFNCREGDISRVTILDCVFADVNSEGCVCTNEPIICIGSVIYGDNSFFQDGTEEQVKYQSVLQGNLNMRDGIAMKISKY